uniref:Uncharacterized protein n=1 Tax=Arundo donax TaxID=35708 RepID=A0A0A9H774_ARUDO
MTSKETSSCLLHYKQYLTVSFII